MPMLGWCVYKGRVRVYKGRVRVYKGRVRLLSTDPH